MKRNHINVNLTNGENGQLVEASLFEGISDENLNDYEENWLPILKEAKLRYLAERKIGKEAPRVEDAHWDWSGKINLTRSLLSHRHFAIESESGTEGLMQLELVMHRSRIEDGNHLVYVDLISVAPWNRRALFEVPRFKGVGSILYAQSIGTSFDEGFSGRVGLHSLPGATGWYKKMGMIPFGPDKDYQNLEYFEMRKEDSTRFIQQMGE